MKHLLILFLFLLIALSGFSQSSVTWTQYLRLNPNARTLVNDGEIHYRLSTHKLRARIDGVNENIATESFVTSAIAAGPYIPLTGTGTLTGHTTVDGSGGPYDFKFLNIREFELSASDIGTFSVGSGPLSFTGNSVAFTGSGNTLNIGGSSIELNYAAGQSTLSMDGNSSLYGLLSAGLNTGGNLVLNSSTGKAFLTTLHHNNTVDTVVMMGGDGQLFSQDRTSFLSGGVANGDKGDITVSGINTWTVDANIVKTWTGKHTFGPTATTSGLNVGALAGAPSSPVNGDLWYHTGTGVLGTYLSGATYSIPIVAASQTSGRMAYWSNTYTLTNSANLTYNGTTLGITSGALSVASGSGTFAVGTNSLVTHSFSGGAIGNINLFSLTPSFNPSSGSNDQISFSVRPTYNNTGTHVGSAIGYDYNPTATSLTGTTHYAFRAVSGNVLIGATAITASTKVDIRGVSSGNILRLANSSNTRRFNFSDAGVFSIDVAPTLDNAEDQILGWDNVSKEVELLDKSTLSGIPLGGTATSTSNIVVNGDGNDLTLGDVSDGFNDINMKVDNDFNFVAGTDYNATAQAVNITGTSTGTKITGGLLLSYTAVTGAYTALTTDYTMEATSGTPFTIALPPAAGNTGRIYVIFNNSNTGNLTVNPNASELINTSLTETLAFTQRVIIQCNGTGWLIIN
jgi:hypothetical protein